ncbi:methyltransferase domain-containing protein [Patescibacteria group bacterium]|nr:methyltransferase domain-containing protein [Patescibacteria group bacterium]
MNIGTYKKRYAKTKPFLVARNIKGRIKRLSFKAQIGIKGYPENMKLDVCGGHCPIGKGYINVDLRHLPQVDVIADVRKNIPFSDQSVSEVFSCGTLEHFNMSELKSVLKEFFRVLKPGGMVAIGVPDLEKLCKAYTANVISFDQINQYLYGRGADMKYAHNLHKNIFDFENMKAYLIKAGFKEVEKVPYDLPFHIPEFMMKVVCKK